MWPINWFRRRPPPLVSGLDQEATDTLNVAAQIAKQAGFEYIGSEHILLALFSDELVCDLCRRSGIDPAEVRADVLQILRAPLQTASQVPSTLTPRAESAVRLAVESAVRMNSAAASPGHLLLGLLMEEEAVAAQVLLDHGANRDVVRAALESNS